MTFSLDCGCFHTTTTPAYHLYTPAHTAIHSSPATLTLPARAGFAVTRYRTRVCGPALRFGCLVYTLRLLRCAYAFELTTTRCTFTTCTHVTPHCTLRAGCHVAYLLHGSFQFPAYYAPAYTVAEHLHRCPCRADCTYLHGLPPASSAFTTTTVFDC